MLESSGSHRCRGLGGPMVPRIDPAHHGFESLRLPANGIVVHGAQVGHGRPLLLLHGWLEFWLAWAPCMRRLADRFRLLAPDLRGFGDTGKPASGPSRDAGP